MRIQKLNFPTWNLFQVLTNSLHFKFNISIIIILISSVFSLKDDKTTWTTATEYLTSPVHKWNLKDMSHWKGQKYISLRKYWCKNILVHNNWPYYEEASPGVSTLDTLEMAKKISYLSIVPAISVSQHFFSRRPLTEQNVWLHYIDQLLPFTCHS